MAPRGRPPWFETLLEGEFQHFLLRRRADLAEPFADLVLTPHPWTLPALALIGAKVVQTLSLFLQLEAQVAQRENALANADHPDWTDISLQLEYPDRSNEQAVFWSAGPTAYRSDRPMVFDSRRSDDDEGGPDRYVLSLHLRAERFHPRVLKFLESQLEFQVKLPRPGMARMRGNSQHPPTEWIESVWDLRIRLTDFIQRFLSRFRRQHIVDPFTVFFLAPASLAEGDRHIRSGHFGYEFVLDGGQLQELEHNWPEFAEGGPAKPLRLVFPNGVCATVFLEARASRAHDLTEITKTYRPQPDLDRVKRFEEDQLGRGALIEVPVYAPGVGRGPADGPELIVTIRVIPAHAESPVTLDPWEGWGPEPRASSDPAPEAFRCLASVDPSILLDGEAQILTEFCQRLISIYLRATNVGSTDAVVFRSPAMRRIQEKYRRIARSGAHVLLYGASGTGKSEAAREIAWLSGRDFKKYRRISAATISRETTMSQLFGYVVGAHDTAFEPREGLLKFLNGGTLFLDDVDALDEMAQARLLSYLDTKRFCPFGGEDGEEQESDVRLICATNVEIRELLKPERRTGRPRLRRDFLYRIAEQYVQLPRLDDRKEDIPVLIDIFVESQFRTAARDRAPRVDPSFLAAAMEQSWSNGDLRQLKHAVLAAMIQTDRPVLMAHDLKEALDTLAERNWDQPGPSEGGK
jgi:hypothetical protein